MSEHTPGPWAESPHAVPDWHTQIGVYAEAGGRDLAIVTSSAADAHLIAAAPDLLAALRNARSYVEQTRNHDPHDLAAIVEAIAKAEGRA